MSKQGVNVKHLIVSGNLCVKIEYICGLLLIISWPFFSFPSYSSVPFHLLCICPCPLPLSSIGHVLSFASLLPFLQPSSLAPVSPLPTPPLFLHWSSSVIQRLQITVVTCERKWFGSWLGHGERGRARD